MEYRRRNHPSALLEAPARHYSVAAHTAVSHIEDVELVAEQAAEQLLVAK